MKTVEPGAVLRGALAGLLVIVPLSAFRAVIDNQSGNFDDSGWVFLFGVGLLSAYVVAGAVAAYRTPTTPMTNGTLAGLGAFVLWIPLRILIWAARSESQGLFSGLGPGLHRRSALRPAALRGRVRAHRWAARRPDGPRPRGPGRRSRVGGTAPRLRCDNGRA